MKIEIERRWLLKSAPTGNETHKIVQVYTRSDDDECERYRSSEADGKATFTRTVKRPVSHGICEEDEHECTPFEFANALVIGGPYLIKMRTNHAVGRHVYEVDTYQLSPKTAMDLCGQEQLVIMEVELGSIDELIDIPFQDLIIREVTGEKDLSNLAIARRSRER